MTFILFSLSIFLAVFGFGLGSWIYFERRDDVRNITLSALLLSASFWVFAFALLHASTESRQLTFWFRSLYVIASLLPTLVLLFAAVFPKGLLPRLAVQAALFIPNLALFWVAFFTSWLVKPGSIMAEDPGRIAFGIHFALVLAVAAAVLGRRLRDRQIIIREQARIVLVAMLSFVPLVWALYLAPSADAGRWYLAAALAVETGMLMAATAVIRRRLLVDARHIGTEVFFSLAFSAFVVDLVISESTLDFSIRLSILILLALYGGMTAKTLVGEVRRREEIQALNDQLVNVNGHLLALDRMKTTFVSMASHQLRAPLAGMRGYLELIRDGVYGPVTAKQREIVGANLDAADRLLATIENFLDIAKIELGKLEIIKGPASLKTLVARAIDELGILAAKKGLTLKATIPAAFPEVRCDAGKLYHVILNLIDNAIKYTDSGSIEVTARREKDLAAVSVIDTGAGLTPDERKGLFQLFSRGKQEFNPEIGGSGLGLYILKSIVEAHGGSVFVESAGRGRGSTFGFRIPIK